MLLVSKMRQRFKRGSELWWQTLTFESHVSSILPVPHFSPATHLS